MVRSIPTQEQEDGLPDTDSPELSVSIHPHAHDLDAQPYAKRSTRDAWLDPDYGVNVVGAGIRITDREPTPSNQLDFRIGEPRVVGARESCELPDDD
jgi:hypothetical protein